MRYVEIDGMRVSRIGLGTWQFGSREWGYGETYARETAPVLGVLRAAGPVHEVDGVGPIDVVQARIRAALGL